MCGFRGAGHLGEALGSRGEKQEAVHEFRIAIQLNPRDSDSHYDLGRMTLESGDIAGAIPDLEAAVRLSPESETFHQELAEAYIAAHRPEDAQKEMEVSNLLRARTQSGTLSRQTTVHAQ